jgi:hypothetical protein
VILVTKRQKTKALKCISIYLDSTKIHGIFASAKLLRRMKLAN